MTDLLLRVDYDFTRVYLGFFSEVQKDNDTELSYNIFSTS